jgi:hypothetical protein
MQVIGQQLLIVSVTRLLREVTSVFLLGIFGS